MQILVQDMSCQHCVATITGALRALDPAAAVQCHLDTHVVDVTTSATPEHVAATIVDAGYTAVLQQA